MSIPLDRLYNFLHDISNHDINNNIIIYRWTPHGSRKKEDCKPLINVAHSTFQQRTKMPIVCHDQEPLQFDDFGVSTVGHFDITGVPFSQLRNLIQSPWMLHDRIMLCHSELNSKELQKFEQHGVVGVYYWSHALIALDWFRYAAFDPNLKKSKKLKNLFLVYNRAWSGSREYRLKFTEMILENNLVDCCAMRFNPTESDLHYFFHIYRNPRLQVKHKNAYKIEQHFPINDAPSHASADYESSDYQTTGIEVVLETLFDDSRWHLTEKTLRPIACAQPFILTATPSSLEYLRSYGFQTFDSVWDESYDKIIDPVARLEAIVKLMKDLERRSHCEDILSKVQHICAHNQRWFFSAEFHHRVISEYQTNLDQAVKIMGQHANGTFWKAYMRDRASLDDLTEKREDVVKIWRWLQDQKAKKCNIAD
jgi:hypothetical protein